MLGEQHPEASLDRPDGADLTGRIGVEHGGEAAPLLVGQVVGAGQEQFAVHPQLVTLAAAAAKLLAGDPLPRTASRIRVGWGAVT